MCEGEASWEKSHPRNHAVSSKKLYDSNNKWKKYGCHKRSLSETAMYSVKSYLEHRQLIATTTHKSGESYAMIKALNKLIGLVKP